MSHQPQTVIRAHLSPKLSDEELSANANRPLVNTIRDRETDRNNAAERLEMHIQDIPLPPEKNSQNWNEERFDPKVTFYPQRDTFYMGQENEDPLLRSQLSPSTTIGKQAQSHNKLLPISPSLPSDFNASLLRTSENARKTFKIDTFTQNLKANFPDLIYDPIAETASSKNIFDSHCHLDRMFR